MVDKAPIMTRILHLTQNFNEKTMKYLLPLFAIVLFASCGSHNHKHADEASTETTEETNAGWYGEEFEMTEAISAGDIAGLMSDSSANEFVIKGEIEECCQKKGCWMKVATAGGESMRVSFKDYEFFVPLDAAGSTMTMRGVAMYDTINVDFLKHLAEDANATQEEIDAITEPELAITFEATGVLID
ncbi:MAG: hypothetical protein ACI9UR_002851 [Bacteroidia bacterium]